MKRVWIALLAVLLVLAIISVDRIAGVFIQQLDRALNIKIDQLQQKYSIHVEYISAQGVPIIDEENLETLDIALETVTPALVKHVSDYYRQKTGNPLQFCYTQGEANTQMGEETVLAGFQEQTARIELYLPVPESSVITTGENPISIVHEFGHALHFMYADRYGYDKMQAEWTAFNAGAAYDAANLRANPDNSVFVSGYAATMYEEDFAETIGHVFVRHRAGQGFLNRLNKNGHLTGLGRKVAYIEQILASIEGADSALQNYCRMYSAQQTVTYQKMSFSGEYLQFAGYPPPRYVLGAVLDQIGKSAVDSLWVRDIGGWHVRQATGPSLIIFPGGTWCEIADSPVEFVSYS